MMPQPPPGQGPIDPRGAFSLPGAPGAPGAPAGGGVRPSMPPNMPPQMMPPQMMPPPYFPPPPRRGGAGRIILILLATFSIIINFCLFAFLILPGGSESASETVLMKGDTSEIVAV